MFSCNLKKDLTSLEKLIQGLASKDHTDNFLREPLLPESRSSTPSTQSSSEIDWIPLNRAQVHSKKPFVTTKQRCALAFVFIGQLFSTFILTVPVGESVNSLLLNTTSSEINSLFLSYGLLTLPFLLSVLDCALSVFSDIQVTPKLDREDIIDQLTPYSINGLPARLRHYDYKKKKHALLTSLRIAGSLYSPVCYAITAADIAYVASQSEIVCIAIFSVSLTSFLLDSQIDHSFFLLSKFITEHARGKETSPNSIQQTWIKLGCWLNMKRRWTNCIHSSSIIAISFGIPHFIIDSYDAWPNHLYWGGLMGLSAAACLSQLEKNWHVIQSQNEHAPRRKVCAERTRSIFFDRPELALLWKHSTRSKPVVMCIFAVLSIALLLIPIFDEFNASPNLNDYRVDACIFSFGILLSMFTLHSIISMHHKNQSDQISYSSWESMLLACSSSSMLQLMAKLADYEITESAFKVAAFAGIYLLSSLVITARDSALNRIQLSSLFWQQPEQKIKNRKKSLSDGVLHKQTSHANPLLSTGRTHALSAT